MSKLEGTVAWKISLIEHEGSKENETLFCVTPDCEMINLTGVDECLLVGVQVSRL